MSAPKAANPDHPIHDLLAARWSPYSFTDRPVPEGDLKSIFEAARWAASSYNEQPWRYIVATKADAEGFDTLLSCLVEANQAWARNAPVLAIGCFSRILAYNGKPNAAAEHDLGAASAALTMEATARGLFVHQMIGIDPERARQLFSVPEDYQPLTGIAIGYLGDAPGLDPKYGERDRAPRQRKPLSEIVFQGRWGEPSGLIG
ncbi:malonic semialdehyde reductase [Aquisphaera giovannonii]|uniref:Malonic semialdehyde reductase n=1 Tax=Aquisphaera giovannonii TaxID=406548 RepID=A0A5B9W1V9_9BACT|nr:nitroreductase family protein [Aquisphaera giovannonii]QEH34214.1 malonic semialdehyde reductase [Aquisphaera giovannonii]